MEPNSNPGFSCFSTELAGAMDMELVSRFAREARETLGSTIDQEIALLASLDREVLERAFYDLTETDPRRLLVIRAAMNARKR